VDLFLIPNMVDDYKQLPKLGISTNGSSRSLCTMNCCCKHCYHILPSRDQLMVLLKAAAARNSKLSVTQVMDTGASFAEVEAILKEMVKVDMSESIT